MKHKIGESVPYGTEHYMVVGIDEAARRYYLEPETDDDVVKQLADRFWVDAKDID
jgi:hypothetical protein